MASRSELDALARSRARCRFALAPFAVATLSAFALAPACSLRNVDDLYGGVVDAGAHDVEAGAPTCKKDCLGGECILGHCQPFALATGRSQPWGVAVDKQSGSSDVYWSELRPAGVSGAAFKLVPGAEPVKIIDAKVGPTWLFITQGRLFWTGTTSPGAVGRCPLLGAGCVYVPGVDVTPPGSIVASGLNGTTYVNNPDSVVADGTGVYWTNAGSLRTSVDGSLVVCPASGCGQPGPRILATSLAHPRGIAIDETYVYWVNEGLPTSDDSGSVLRIPKIGGTAERLATHQSSPAYIAVDADYIYWTNRGSGEVMMRAKAGGDTQVLASGQGGAWAIATDSSGVYWTTWGPNGAVSMCPLGGCTDAGVVTVAGALDQPYGLALDDTAVYFTTFSEPDGAVMKVAKP